MSNYRLGCVNATQLDSREGAHMDRIVVGVDGSQHSIDALRWALDEARAHQASLEAIITWSYPVAADAYGGAMTIDPTTLAEGARQTLDNAIATACSDPEEQAAITRTVVEGGAGRALVEASRAADLLVVGSRGHGGFTGLLLGSVSSQCMHHAHCPITVVRQAQ